MLPGSRTGLPGLVTVIGAALAAKAAGTGARTVAAALGRPAETVRGWVRRFAGRAEAVRVAFTALLVGVGVDPVPPAAAVTVVAVAGASAAVRSRWPDAGEVPPWLLAAALIEDCERITRYHTGIPELAKDALRAALRACHEANKERNRVIHDTWATRPGNVMVTLRGLEGSWPGSSPAGAQAPARGMRMSIRGLAVGLAAGFAPWFALLVACLLALLVGGLGFGFGAGYAALLVAVLLPGLWFGVPLGLAGGLAVVPGDLAEVTSPGTVLARDRQVALVLVLAPGFALAVGLVAGLGLSLSQTAWPSYMLAREWLAFHHLLPWSLMSFVHETHQRGILRQAGAVYQFRHMELQRRLATRL